MAAMEALEEGPDEQQATEAPALLGRDVTVGRKALLAKALAVAARESKERTAPLQTQETGAMACWSGACGSLEGVGVWLLT